MDEERKQLIERLKKGISKSRLKRLHSNIDQIRQVGVVVGLAYPNTVFRLLESDTEESAPYPASVFFEFIATNDVKNLVYSSKNKVRTIDAPAKNSISKDAQRKCEIWLRDFRSTFAPWSTIRTELYVPSLQRVHLENGIVSTGRDDLLWVFDFLRFASDMAFMSTRDYDTMPVIFDQKVSERILPRSIPGHDPWEHSTAKHRDSILNRFWHNTNLDLESVILVEDLAYYFETIIVGVIDWISPENAPATTGTKPDLKRQQKIVFDLIWERGPITAPEISLETGISVGRLRNHDYLGKQGVLRCSYAVVSTGDGYIVSDKFQSTR